MTEETQPLAIPCPACGANVLELGFGVSTAAWIHRYYSVDPDGYPLYHGDDDEIGNNLETPEQLVFCQNCGCDIGNENAAVLIDIADNAESAN